MISINENRLKHSLAVARLMEQKAREMNWQEEKCREMFVLGYLHDIGYEYVEKQMDHPVVGGLLLKETNYKYWREVYYHGSLNPDYESEELTLLNTCDMLVNSYGEVVSSQERLEDIGNRYGKDSEQYHSAKLLMQKLNLL